ncbi:MAG: hypothetical protein PHS57_06435 [Alphaproteobacteria bacterium]|nr:hypothetical protein [Alphaproteobacteria bacterium]
MTSKIQNVLKNRKEAANANVNPFLDQPTTLNVTELTSVRALIAYVAYTNELSEALIRSLVEAYFDTDNIENIFQDDYDRAIAYLVDLDPRKAVN